MTQMIYPSNIFTHAAHPSITLLLSCVALRRWSALYEGLLSKITSLFSKYLYKVELTWNQE